MTLRAPGPIRFDRHELSGALGDLGTFVPLFVGLAQRGLVAPGAALLAAGLANVATGLAFGLPMAVQPMKAIAALALAGALDATEVATAGLVTSAVVVALAATGALDVVVRRLPRALVRGVQLAVALRLARSGFALVTSSHTWGGFTGLGVAIAAFALTAALLQVRRVPAALVTFGLGLAWTLATRGSSSEPSAAPIASHAARLALGPPVWRAAAAQLPLTLLNSVLAPCALAAELFPGRAPSPRRVAWSVGAMNVVSLALGGMPLCHGAGGLAGQYRFGARTGGSVVLLGAAMIALGAGAAASAYQVLAAYPRNVLGVLVLFAALELGQVVLRARGRALLVAVATGLLLDAIS